MKRLLIVLLVLLALPAVPLLLAAWLLGTEAGTRFAAEQAQEWVPGLRIEAVEGSLLSPLVLRGLHFENEAATVEIDRATLHWRPRSLLRGRLRINDLQAGTVNVTLRETPPDDEQTPPISELPLGLRVVNAGVQHLRLQLAGTEAPLLIDAIGVDLRWVGRRVELRKLAATLPGTGPLLASAELRLSPERVQVQQLRLSGPGAAELKGEYAYAGEFDAELRWQDLRWPLLEEPMLTSPEGEATVKGSLESYAYQLKARFAEARAAVALEAEGDGTMETLRLQRLQAKGLGGSLDAKADIAWAPQLRVDAEGEMRGIHPGQVLPELAGVLNGRFRVQTQLQDGKPRIGFNAALYDSVWREYKLDLKAEGLYADDILTLASAELRSGPTRLKASGRVWPTLDAKGELASTDLAPLWPGLGGRVQAKLQAQGPVEGPRVKLQADAQQLRYQDYGLASLKLQADGDLRGSTNPEDWKLQAMLDARSLAAGDIRAASLQFDGNLDLRRDNRLRVKLADADAGLRIAAATLELDGSLGKHELRLAAQTEQGDAELALRGAADLTAQRWRGQLASGRLAPEQLAAWTLEEPADLELSAIAQSLGAACWRSAPARACLRLLRDPRVQRVAFRLEDFAYAYLQPFLPKGWEVDGSVDGSGQIDLTPGGQITVLRADLATSAGQWTVNERKLFEFKAGTAQLLQEGDSLRAKLDLPFAQGLAKLDARLGPGALLVQRPLSGEVQVELPELTWLRLFTTEVTSVEGSIGGQFQLGGTLEKPLVQGELALRNGKLRLATPGIEVGPITGSLRGGSEGVLDLDISGTSGGGEIRIAGRIDPRSEPMQADIRVTGKDFQAARLPSAKVWISPDLKLGLSKRQLRVTGEVLVPRAEIAPPDFATGIGPSSDQVIVGRDGQAPESSGLFKLLAEVQLKLGDKVSFKGYGLTTRFGGGITIFEESGRDTRASGEINLIGGRYKAYGQDLSIETGRLIYSGGFITEPLLELKAERKPTEDVTVGILVRGTLDKPQFSVYSTPSMTQQQQLSWLILGRPMDEGNNTEGDRNMLASAALALGLSGGGFLANRLGTSVGIDEITVGSKPGESSDQARLTVGKYLSPKLYVSYGIGIFQPGNIFKLAYDLGRGFKLQTESGVEAGGDLLYTIER
ncbi:translocation/assembly module TamB domain-containing protein [Solimonas sp. SE-A11]|uniref:translocation/assembly module TamB domain-containing protein n=1 Tax=Solimonas sp. SE-A11 TaxID=3054954 RepID=UPI00259CF8FF|nr:translocation/assembly module TamB domain-containing protein [Solimonas sp. SE-A11]